MKGFFCSLFSPYEHTVWHAEIETSSYPSSTTVALPIQNSENDDSQNKHANAKSCAFFMGNMTDLIQKNSLNERVHGTTLEAVKIVGHLTIDTPLQLVGPLV